MRFQRYKMYHFIAVITRTLGIGIGCEKSFLCIELKINDGVLLTPSSVGWSIEFDLHGILRRSSVAGRHTWQEIHFCHLPEDSNNRKDA